MASYLGEEGETYRADLKGRSRDTKFQSQYKGATRFKQGTVPSFTLLAMGQTSHWPGPNRRCWSQSTYWTWKLTEPLWSSGAHTMLLQVICLVSLDGKPDVLNAPWLLSSFWTWGQRRNSGRTAVRWQAVKVQMDITISTPPTSILVTRQMQCQNHWSRSF